MNRNNDIPITTLCEHLGVSRQSFYQWRHRRKAQLEGEQTVIEWVQEYRRKHPRMGGRKLYYLLAPRLRACDLKIGRDKFFELLRRHRLLVPPRRSRAPRTTDGRWTRWKNELQATVIDAPYQGWVADISYLRTVDGFCYMALISDVYSRKIIGWDVSQSLEMEGTLRALEMALEHLPPTAYPIHHSDRGSQYRSNAYIRRLRQRGCTVSMTEHNHCAENAQAERLNGILKGEYYLDSVFTTTQQARSATEAAITLYNQERPHINLNFQSPEQVHRATQH